MKASPPLVEDEVVDALEQLRLEGAAGPDPRTQARARRAMLVALEARPKRRWFIAFLYLPLQPRRLIGEFAVVMLAVLGVMGAIGWSAPAGTPFHGIREAREAIAHTISGENRLDVDLGFAEQYLVEAARNQARQASLNEARKYLDDARGLLPADLSDPYWQRWRVDEDELSALGTSPPETITIQVTSTPKPTPSATAIASASASAGASARPSPSPSSDDRSYDDRATPRPSPSASVPPAPSSSPQVSPSPTPE